MNQPYSRVAQLGTLTSQQKTLSMYMTTAKMFNNRNPKSELSFGASTGANPTVEWYWNCWAINILGSNITGDTEVSGSFWVTYYVTFRDRVTIPES